MWLILDFVTQLKVNTAITSWRFEFIVLSIIIIDWGDRLLNLYSGLNPLVTLLLIKYTWVRRASRKLPQSYTNVRVRRVCAYRVFACSGPAPPLGAVGAGAAARSWREAAGARARHAGRPPGARSPAEHFPRKYHTPLLITASVFHLFQM